MTIYKASFFRVCEKQNCVGDIAGRGETAHWIDAFDICIVIASAGLIGHVHFGFHPTRANSIDANTAATPLCRERAREPDEPVLRRVVGGAITDTDQSRN